MADYIPSLASISSEHSGIAIADPARDCFSAGDAETPFSVQSISKVFSLTMALGAVGDALWHRVGRESFGLINSRQ
ncbi:glutaminase [Hellea sp.]|nr:glutaminase [Hellea sp.]